jgi:large subunit ribosomal protein L3
MSEQVNNETTVARGASAGEVVLSGARAGLLGVKAGMTQIYNESGDCVPVTVIDLQPSYITQVKSKDRDGYNAVQVGIMPRKAQRCTKADKGHFKKSGNAGYEHVTEFRVDSLDGIKEGAVISLDFITNGDLIDVAATSKGKGFQGVMKRHNFGGSPKSHGASVSHRAPGSIGNRADPGRVFPGKKMAGHMGSKRVTIQNLEVVGVDKENRLLLVKGSIPGPKQSVVRIIKAVKAR